MVASYFATLLGSKLLGIGIELQNEANERVPAVVNVIWKFVSFLVLIVIGAKFGSWVAGGRFQVPLSSFHALLLLYGTAAFRDIFLMRFYFGRALPLA